MIDNAVDVATPEGCSLTLRLAGPISRARAWAIDMMIRLTVMMFTFQVLQLIGKFAMVGFVLLAFALEWAYPVLFEVYWDGKTPGKSACNLMVVNRDGTPVGWGSSVVRNTLRFLDFLPFLYGVGLLTMLVASDFRRLGDLAAGTVVVYRDEFTALPVVPEGGRLAAPAVPLQIDEQRAVIEFVRRAPLLTEDRAEELARLAEPILDQRNPSASDGLLRIGHFLLGRR